MCEMQFKKSFPLDSFIEQDNKHVFVIYGL